MNVAFQLWFQSTLYEATRVVLYGDAAALNKRSDK